MSQPDPFATLLAAMPMELRAGLAPLLQRIVHDASTPVSTVAMEVYSAQLLFDHARTGRTADTAQLHAELEAIFHNVGRAAATLTDLLARLDELARAAGGDAADASAAPAPGGRRQ